MHQLMRELFHPSDADELLPRLPAQIQHVSQRYRSWCPKRPVGSHVAAVCRSSKTNTAQNFAARRRRGEHPACSSDIVFGIIDLNTKATPGNRPISKKVACSR